MNYDLPPTEERRARRRARQEKARQRQRARRRRQLALLAAIEVVMKLMGLDGKVKTAGWIEDSGLDYLAFAKQMEGLGVKTLIFTEG